jgi:hypothetical protein
MVEARASIIQVTEPARFQCLISHGASIRPTQVRKPDIDGWASSSIWILTLLKGEGVYCACHGVFFAVFAPWPLYTAWLVHLLLETQDVALAACRANRLTSGQPQVSPRVPCPALDRPSLTALSSSTCVLEISLWKIKWNKNFYTAHTSIPRMLTALVVVKWLAH